MSSKAATSNEVRYLKFPEEYNKMKELLNDCTSTRQSRLLTEWEKNFVASITTNFTAFGKGTKFSEKQLAILAKIEEKIYKE